MHSSFPASPVVPVQQPKATLQFPIPPFSPAIPMAPAALWLDDPTSPNSATGFVLPDLRSVPMKKPQAKRLFDLMKLPEKDPNEIFLNRLLCRRGTALFVGETGRGKSTFLMGGAISWALGKEYHGFRPLRPLRILVAQAENDDFDLREQLLSAVVGLSLTPAELQVLNDSLYMFTINDKVGAEFTETLRRLALEHRADLIVIDPVLAFLGGDANSQTEVGGFLRQQLAPVLSELNAAAILVHHTAKPSSAGKKAAVRQDAYLGAGSAEWANFARCVFGLNETAVEGFYELALHKRGRRASWRNDDGDIVTRRYLRQSRIEGELRWLPVTYKEFEAASDTVKGKVVPSVEEFVSLFPKDFGDDPRRALLSTDEIKARFKTNGWDQNAYPKLREIAQVRGVLDVLVGPRNSKLTGRSDVVQAAKAAADLAAKGG